MFSIVSAGTNDDRRSRRFEQSTLILPNRVELFRTTIQVAVVCHHCGGNDGLWAAESLVVWVRPQHGLPVGGQCGSTTTRRRECDCACGFLHYVPQFWLEYLRRNVVVIVTGCSNCSDASRFVVPVLTYGRGHARSITGSSFMQTLRRGICGVHVVLTRYNVGVVPALRGMCGIAANRHFEVRTPSRYDAALKKRQGSTNERNHAKLSKQIESFFTEDTDH